MVKKKVENPKGVLGKQNVEKPFQHTQYIPPKKLSYYVEHFWFVKWLLPQAEQHTQQVLSHPSVHLSIEENKTRIWGVITSKFSRTLTGKGKVFGVKFRPGGFYPFFNRSVSEITNSHLSCDEIFQESEQHLESTLASSSVAKLIETVEQLLLSKEPTRDPKIEFVNSIFAEIKSDRSIRSVDQIADRFHMHRRTLQRLFKKYVGVGPKWIIQRYRLHDAAEMVASDQDTNFSQLAYDLGYFDLSHFIRDFKQIVGETPASVGDQTT